MVMMMSKVGVHCVRACPPPLKRRFKNNICRAECNRASRTAGVVRPLRRRYGFSGAGVAGRAPRIALAGSTQEDGEPAPSSTDDIENLIRAKRRKSPIDERMQRSLGARVAGDDEDEDEDELTLEQRVWRVREMGTKADTAWHDTTHHTLLAKNKITLQRMCGLAGELTRAKYVPHLAANSYSELGGGERCSVLDEQAGDWGPGGDGHRVDIHRIHRSGTWSLHGSGSLCRHASATDAMSAGLYRTHTR